MGCCKDCRFWMSGDSRGNWSAVRLRGRPYGTCGRAFFEFDLDEEWDKGYSSLSEGMTDRVGLGCRVWEVLDEDGDGHNREFRSTAFCGPDFGCAHFAAKEGGDD